MAVSVAGLLGRVVALVCIATGAALLLGLVQRSAPPALRLGCGALLVLLGINRWMVTRMRARPPRRRFFDVPDR